ncbi:hypothetical protein ACFSAG_05815 [Sphingorhabdus buctiana]|uniref:Uncharacterized protein n=1 Tax=Sphingorhabdus buctiana TaxID=1508805 RepID=A0ABW4MCD1_9SPHN
MKRPSSASAGSNQVANNQVGLRFQAATNANMPIARNKPPISALILAAPIAPIALMPRAASKDATSNQCWLSAVIESKPIMATNRRETPIIA